MRIETFSDGCQARGGLIRGMDARLKIILSVCCIAICIASSGIAVPIFIGAMCLGLVIASGASLKSIALRMAEPLVFSFALALFQAAVSKGAPGASFKVVGIAVVLSADGIARGMHLVARAFGAVSAVLFLSMTTPVYRLLSAASGLRFPKGLVELLFFSYRYIFVLMEDAVTVYHSQKGRLGYAGPVRGIRSLGVLFGSVLFRAYSQAEATGAAMVLRGYTGEYIPENTERLRASDLLIFAFLLSPCLAYCLWTL
ncbi:MAG: cobalt ECF transporter T component CbiQ [Nitrospirota bacterium]